MKKLALLGCLLLAGCGGAEAVLTSNANPFPPGASNIKRIGQYKESYDYGYYTYTTLIDGVEYKMLHKISDGSHNEKSHSFTVLAKRPVTQPQESIWQ